MALKQFPKTKYYRSKKHLFNVSQLPCMVCGTEGLTQACHSNWAEHGKGRGIKASDEFTAAMCHHCHYILDQHPALTKTQRREMWDEAYKKTVDALVEQGLWEVK